MPPPEKIVKEFAKESDLQLFRLERTWPSRTTSPTRETRRWLHWRKG